MAGLERFEAALAFCDRLVEERRIVLLTASSEGGVVDADSYSIAGTNYPSDPHQTMAERKYRYGSFLYCIPSTTNHQDVSSVSIVAEFASKVDMRSKLQVEIDRPCSGSTRDSFVERCHFRSKAVFMEFISASLDNRSFAIRNPENHYIEWGRVMKRFVNIEVRKLLILSNL